MEMTDELVGDLVLAIEGACQPDPVSQGFLYEIRDEALARGRERDEALRELASVNHALSGRPALDGITGRCAQRESLRCAGRRRQWMSFETMLVATTFAAAVYLAAREAWRTGYRAGYHALKDEIDRNLEAMRANDAEV